MTLLCLACFRYWRLKVDSRTGAIFARLCGSDTHCIRRYFTSERAVGFFGGDEWRDP